MAHFCELDSDNNVLRTVVINDADCLDSDGNESESVGVSFCQSLFGADTTWKQTSYNSNFRKNYGGIGYSYDASRDAFIPNKPYPSWVLNETTCRYEAPIDEPSDKDTVAYYWDEDVYQADNTQGWVAES